MREQYFAQMDRVNGGWILYRGFSCCHYRSIAAMKLVTQELGVSLILLNEDGEKLN
jgi:hypothetical protein